MSEPHPYYDEGGITIYHGDCREEQARPEPMEYGQLVDKMVATVETWPPEYQRSIDVHGFDSPMSAERGCDVSGKEVVRDNLGQPARVCTCGPGEGCSDCPPDDWPREVYDWEYLEGEFER